MRLSQALALLAVACPLAFADVEFTIPAAGGSYPAGKAISVKWKDSGDSPSISDLSKYRLHLYTGSNDNPVGSPSLHTHRLRN
jgi:hypothetical protein